MREVISPWQGLPHPEGGLGATRLQPQHSLLPLSLMTLSSLGNTVHIGKTDSKHMQHLTKMYLIQPPASLEFSFNLTRSEILN